MAKNLKTIIMQRSRTGIVRAVYQRPMFGTAYALLHQFLSLTTLSRRNIMWASKCVQDIRENPEMGIENVEVQEKLLQLDRAVVEAKARLQRREKREKQKATAGLKEPKRKNREPTEPALGASPWDSNSDFYKQLLAEQKKEQENNTEEKEIQLPASGDNNANH